MDSSQSSDGNGDAEWRCPFALFQPDVQCAEAGRSLPSTSRRPLPRGYSARRAWRWRADSGPAEYATSDRGSPAVKAAEERDVPGRVQKIDEPQRGVQHF